MLNLALLILFLLAAFCDAANKYVKPGGTGDGSSWSSAGSPGVINSSAAGDVIYLGGGSYGNGIAVQASSVTIKRATAANHGSDTGWSASLDKQATFDSGWLVSGSNVTIDGNCWKPPGLPTVFGFRIKHASAAKGIDAGGSPGGLKCIDLDIPGPGINSSKAEADGIHFPSNSTISGCAVSATRTHSCSAGRGIHGKYDRILLLIQCQLQYRHLRKPSRSSSRRGLFGWNVYQRNYALVCGRQRHF